MKTHRCAPSAGNAGHSAISRLAAVLPILALISTMTTMTLSTAVAEFTIEDCLRMTSNDEGLGSSQSMTPLHEADAIPVDTLRAERVIGGNGRLNMPIDVQFADDGRVLILDFGNNRIVEFDEIGRMVGVVGKAGGDPDGLYGPSSLAVDKSGAWLVADAGNKRLQLWTQHGMPVTLPRHFTPRSVISAGEGLFLVQADPGGAVLLDLIDLEGRRLDEFGETICDRLDRLHVQDALNRISMTRFDDGRIAVAFRTVSHVRVYSPGGRVLSSFDVRGPEIQEMRCFAYFGRLQPYLEPDCRPEKNPSLERMMEEVEFLCRDGRPHGIYYISGMAAHDGLLHLLVNGNVLVYGPEGDLRRRYVLQGPNGESLHSHGIGIDSSGRLAAWDTYHTHEIRIFRVPELAFRNHSSGDPDAIRTGGSR